MNKLMLQFLSKIVSHQREEVLLAIFKVSESVIFRYLHMSGAFFYSDYDDILIIVRTELPSTLEEANRMEKDYQHTKRELTKAVLTTKLKNICTKYRKAVDADKKSGYGRVVIVFLSCVQRSGAGVQPQPRYKVG